MFSSRSLSNDGSIEHPAGVIVEPACPRQHVTLRQQPFNLPYRCLPD
ncbi:hypothetical protein RRSWK_02831 [Rhodopirellula sp. SWK7]|nr:hypothetical protein RRSWK_02831 [Rhodopirellula sp. SWK7]